MRQDVKPSEETEAKVRELAVDAAKNDNHMQPAFDGRAGREPTWSEFQDAHRSTWMETCHFEHYYGNVISDLCDDEEVRFVGKVGDLGFDDRRYGLYEPLIDLFWDTWEQEVHLLHKWNAYRSDLEGRE